MKRCPTCNNTYDDAGSYCVVEGTPLVSVEPAQTELQQTMVSPPIIATPAPVVSAHALEREPPRQAPSGDWAGPQSWAGSPSGPLPSMTEPEGRKMNPLLMVIGGLLLVGLGLGIGVIVTGFGSKSGEAHTTTASANNTASAGNDAMVLSELKELENQMTSASIKGDKATIERILAIDYTATGADGKFYNKDQTLSSTVPTPNVTSWSIDNVRLLSRNEVSATISAVVVFTSGNTSERQQITDTFVKRNGRWQLFASQSTLLK